VVVAVDGCLVMNRIVDKWNKMASRSRSPEPDALTFEDETLAFVPAHERVSKMTKLSVAMNRFAIVDLAMYGPVEKVEVLFRQLHAAVVRIGKRVRGRGFRRPPAGQGMWPNLHDVMQWLNSLDASEEKAEEVAFLHKLYNTCKARVRQEVKIELGI